MTRGLGSSEHRRTASKKLWQSFASVSTVILLTLIAPIGFAFTANIAASPSPNTGAYSITWSNPSGLTYWVQKMPVGGSWSTIGASSGTFLNLTGQTPGDYLHRLMHEEYVCAGWPEPECDWVYTYSETASVTVTNPPPPGGDPFPPPGPFTPPDGSGFPDAAIVHPTDPIGDVGANSVGAVQGNGGVSGGQASYTIPISVPPGRKGMQPGISLSYSSSSGNGAVGVGWGLGAGSSISRCSATAAQDGYTAGPQYNATRDRLCLDGSRLMVVSGTYGASGAEYRTELDSFTRIKQTGAINSASTYFTVDFKDGKTSQYGTTTNSRHIAAGRAEILSWALRTTKDRSGNTINYDYFNYGNGEYHLKEIHYTGLNGSDGDRHVRFTYETRPDVRSYFLAGGKTRSTKRLKSIKTEYQFTTVREYTLDYGSGTSLSTGRSLLRSVQECAYLSGQPHCLRPTIFEWQEHTPQFEMERLQFHNGSAWEVKLADKRWLHDVVPHGDTNGDGVKDWPSWFTNAEGQIVSGAGSPIANCFKKSNSFTLTCLEVDFDADGLTDSFRRSTANKLQVKRNASGGWINTGINWAPSSFPTKADTPLGFADFNGDGWVDLAMKHDSKLWIYKHSKNISAPYSTTNRHLVFTYTQDTSGTMHLQDLQVYGDMDGNGTPDFVSSNTISNRAPGLPTPTGIYLIHSNANGVISVTSRGIGGLGIPIHVNATWFHDINGDGLADLLRIDPDNEGSAGLVQYRLNNGLDFISGWINLGMYIPMREPGVYEFGPGENETYNEPAMSKVLAMDHDGDGKEEILIAGTVVASSCSLVQPIGYRCDDELYGNYHASFYANVGTPINSAIEDDSVRIYSGLKFVEDASGNITTSGFSTGIVGSASQTAVIDATGDGLPDVVTVFGCRFASCGFNAASTQWGGTVVNPTYVEGAWINRNMGAVTGAPVVGNAFNFEPYDLMIAVENGFEVRDEWVYRPLSSDKYSTGLSNFYETTHGYLAGSYDYFHFASSMYVVADHRASDGVGGLNSTKFRYRGAVFNNKGRGFQGFRTIITEEDRYPLGHSLANTDKVSRSDFHQVWPTASIVEQACTWLVVDSISDDNPACINPLSKTVTDTIHDVATSGGARFVAPKVQTSTSYDLASRALLTTKVTSRNFDTTGNVTFESQSHTDAYTTNLSSTTTVYAAPDWSNWWLNRVSSSESTHNPVSARHASSPTVAAGMDMLKELTTSFTQYDTVQRLPTSVTVTSNDSLLTQTVVTIYNSYGLPTNITTTGTDVEGPRTVDMTYSSNGTSAAADGYFPFTAENSLGHISTQHTDPAHGQPILQIDPNGLQSLTTHDAFGRVSTAKPAGQPVALQRYFWCGGAVSCPANAIYKIVTVSAGAPETHSFLDVFGRELQSSVQSFSGTSFVNVRTLYDKRGLQTFVSQPYDLAVATESDSIGTRYLGYDALGRLTAKEIDQPGGQIFLTTYTHSGFQTSINASGLLMHRIYNGLGQLVETLDAEGGFTRYAYDGAGNPIVLADPKMISMPAVVGIQATYNALGHKVWVDDPDWGDTGVTQGKKLFTYNALGEVLAEDDPNGNVIEMRYDKLGRLTDRWVDGELHGKWYYDNPDTYKGLGLLDFEDSQFRDDGSRLQKFYYYSTSASGRKDLLQVTHRFYENDDQNDFTDYSTAYFTDGFYARPKGMRYPGGTGLAYGYNGQGFVIEEKDPSSTVIYRQITARDSRNQVISASLGKHSGSFKYNFTANYFPQSGQMQNISATNGAVTLHSLNYTYDHFGNLKTQSTSAGNTETFTYDDLQRLTLSQRTVNSGGPLNVSYSYDASGSFLSKGDYATQYNYHASRPHVITSVNLINGGGTKVFSHDNNGNLTQGHGESIDYDAFNKPIRIWSGSTTSTFTYGADLARYRQTTPQGTTILYLDKFMEIESGSSNTDYRHFLSDVAILTKTGSLNDANPGIRYLLRDRLGSIATIADKSGLSVESHGYDAFGKPRLGNWADKAPPIHGSAITDRGFTEHEHLDDWQLIHMNGRVYDYNLGRFLSIDPIIQSPGHSQSINPFSYLMNNPLSGTDPSGYAACGDKIEEGSVCQIEITEKFTPLGSRIARETTTTYTVAFNGAQMFVAKGDDRQTFDQIEGAMKSMSGGATHSGGASADDSGPSVGPIPMKIGERRKDPAMCAEFGQRCSNEQFLYDPNKKSDILNVLGDLLGAWRAPNSDGLRINPLTDGIVPNPIDTRVNSMMTMLASALPIPKGVGGRGGQVFWSGIRGGADQAAAWVGRNGGITLELSLTARGTRLPPWNPSNPETIAAWRQASLDFAAGASGHVRVLQGDALRTDSIWRIEYAALKQNPKVTSITSIDLQSGGEILLWSR